MAFDVGQRDWARNWDKLARARSVRFPMFKRISNLFRAFVNSLVGGAERANPKMLLDQEKENLRSQIAQYNQGLATHAGMCERLMTQVRKLEAEEKDLRAKTTAHLRAGNRELAGQMALRLQTISSQLGENRVQLENAEATYQELVKAREVSISAARKKIEELNYAISDMEIKKATAEMMEMAGGMISSIGSSGDTLNRLEEMVTEERERAAGRARVARDSLNTIDFSMQEAEQKALADQALADFAAAEGLAIEPRAATSAGSNANADQALADFAAAEGLGIDAPLPRDSGGASGTKSQQQGLSGRE